MSTLCPYCRQAELRESRGKILYLDVCARALSIARTVFELRSDQESGLRQLAQGLVDPSSLPLATVNDRLCPYCRRGRVTRRALSSVWADASARAAGIARRVLEARRSRAGVPWFELAWMAVDDREPVCVDARSEERVEARVVNVEVVEDDPFDVSPRRSPREDFGEEYDFEDKEDLDDWQEARHGDL